MLVAPAASCAMKKAHEFETTASTGATDDRLNPPPGLPCAMVYGAW